MLKTPLFALCALIGLSLTSPAFAQTSSTPTITVNGASPDKAMPKGDTTTQGTPPIDDKDIYCPTALEPILPGDYYACEARSAYGHENYRKMADLLEEAAYWANKDAQYTLGLTYFNGDMPDVPQDRPLGLAWLALAAERKKDQYVLAYAQARVKATPAELREAQTLWRKMKLKYGDSVAANRAIERFNHNIQDIDDAAREGGVVYLRGFSPYEQSAFSIANKLHDEATKDFEDVHGTVTVGKPQWAQPSSTDKTQATQTATQP
jgi:hypothetical protein